MCYSCVNCKRWQNRATPLTRQQSTHSSKWPRITRDFDDNDSDNDDDHVYDKDYLELKGLSPFLKRRHQLHDTFDKKHPLLLRIKGEAKTNCETVASLHYG